MLSRSPLLLEVELKARQGQKQIPWGWYPSKKNPTSADKKNRARRGDPSADRGRLSSADVRSHVARLATTRGSDDEGAQAGASASHAALMRQYSGHIKKAADKTYNSPSEEDTAHLSGAALKRYLRNHRQSHHNEYHNHASSVIGDVAKAYHVGTPETPDNDGTNHKSTFGHHLYRSLTGDAIDDQRTSKNRGKRNAVYAGRKRDYDDQRMRDQSRRTPEDGPKIDYSFASNVFDDVHRDLPSNHKHIVGHYLRALRAPSRNRPDNIHKHVAERSGQSKGAVTKALQNFHEKVWQHPGARQMKGLKPLTTPVSDKRKDKVKPEDRPAWERSRAQLPNSLTRSTMTYKKAGVYESHAALSGRLMVESMTGFSLPNTLRALSRCI